LKSDEPSEKASIVSLFSGAGGLDLGFEQTGKFQVMLANEILYEPVETYSKNFKVEQLTLVPKKNDLPGISYGDIEFLDLNKIQDLKVDVLTGGPPCQDFSIIRGPSYERQGIKVKRGRLYTHFIRALVRLQPKIFLFENVMGLKSANKGEAWNTILEDFANLPLRWEDARLEAGIVETNNAEEKHGYNLVLNKVVNMSFIGVPQHRRRVIAIGSRDDINHNLANDLSYDLNELVKRSNNYWSKFPLTPIEVFEGRELPELQDKYKKIMTEYNEIFEDIKTDEARKYKESVWDHLTYEIIPDYFFINKIKYDEDDLFHTFEPHREILKELGYYDKRVEELDSSDNTNLIPNEKQTVKDRMAMIPPDKNHEFVSGTQWHVNGRGMSLIYRRIHPLKPSYTVVAYGGGGTWSYHYERNRSALTNRERARLQTFPDDFLFSGNRSKIRAQIGEAVPPLLSKRIGEIITKYL